MAPPAADRQAIPASAAGVAVQQIALKLFCLAVTARWGMYLDALHFFCSS